MDAAAAVVAAVAAAAAAAVLNAARRQIDGLGSVMSMGSSCTSLGVFAVEAGRIVDHADRGSARKLPKQGNLTEGCDTRADMDAAYVSQPSDRTLLLHGVSDREQNKGMRSFYLGSTDLMLNKALNWTCRMDLEADSIQYQGEVDRLDLDRSERMVTDAEVANREQTNAGKGRLLGADLVVVEENWGEMTGNAGDELVATGPAALNG